MTPDPPSGTRCFIDANILVYYFVEHPVFTPPCVALIRRIQSGEITGVTSAMVVSEAMHRIMLSEVQVRFSAPKALSYIQRRPELIQSLTMYRASAEAIEKMPLQFAAITGKTFGQSASIAGKHSLMTNDAITLALLYQEGITWLISNDDEFDTAPGITVCKPR